MSKNIQQVYTANPITSNLSTDLMYFGRAPYGPTNDTAMTYANFAAQFSSSGVASITGTANEIIASAPTGAITLSTPQPIATTSSPTFATVTTTNDSLFNNITVGRGGGSSATNVAVGFEALLDNTTGIQNTAVGQNAGGSNGGSPVLRYSTAIGNQALGDVQNATDLNTAIGSLSMGLATAPGNSNTAVGANTLLDVSFTGQENIAIGAYTMLAATSANYCTGIGYAALATLTTGSNNTAIGRLSGQGNNSGTGLVTGTDNTLIGYQTDVNTTAATGCIAIGSNAIGRANDGVNSSSLSIGSAAFPVAVQNGGALYSTAGAGGAVTPPATIAGYIQVYINGTAYKIAVYPIS